MSKIERFQWIVIYLNIPLWIAVGILFYVFDARIICCWIVMGNIIVLGIGLYLSGGNLFKPHSSIHDNDKEQNG